MDPVDISLLRESIDDIRTIRIQCVKPSCDLRNILELAQRIDSNLHIINDHVNKVQGSSTLNVLCANDLRGS